MDVRRLPKGGGRALARACVAVATLAAVGTTLLGSNPAGATSGPQISLVTGHDGSTPVTLGTPQPSASAQVSPFYSAYDATNGDIAFISGDQAFLIPHVSEANVFNIETASSPVAHTTLTAGDVYLVAGKTTADIVFQPGNSSNPTGSSSAAASANTLAPTSIAFDSVGNLLIGEKTTTHNRTAIQLIPRSSCPSGCLYGITTYTAGNLYTLAGSGNTQPLPSYAAGYTYAVFANGLVVDGSAANNIIASTNGAVVFVNVGTTSLTSYGQTLPSKAATTIAGTASATAGECTAATVTATGSTAPKIAGTPKVALDQAGDLYVADSTSSVTGHGCVWKLAASQASPAKLVRVTGSRTTSAVTNGANAATHDFAPVQALAVDLAGNLLVGTAGTTPSLRVIPASGGTYYSQTMSTGDAYLIAGGPSASGSTLPGTALGFKLSGPTSLVKGSAGTVLLTDGVTATTQNEYMMNGAPTGPPLRITTTSLPSGTASTTYSETLGASGGTPSYHWTFTGTHPVELTLTTTGRLHGTLPSSPTQLSFTVKVTDSGSPVQSVTRALTITVTPAPLTITTQSLPSGEINTAYSETLGASGGTPSYHWTFTGIHPVELTLTTTGRLHGTLPSSPTQLSFTVKVTDSGSPVQSVTKALTITVTPAPLAITTESLPNSVVDVAYSQTLGASGGTPSYHWTFTGTHPAELTLTTTGRLHGTLPSSPTQLSFTVKVTDSGSPVQSVTKALTITVKAVLAITTASLPSGSINSVYAQNLGASGGNTPYSWSFTGSHPAELTLTATGRLHGTLPSSPTVLSFTVKVTDSSAPAQSVTKGLSVTVNAALAISTTSLPAGRINAAYSQTLSAAGGTPPYHWSFTGSHPAELTLTTTGRLHGTLPSSPTQLSFTVKVTDSGSHAVTKALTITVEPALLAITTQNLPSGEVDATYSHTLSASGGTPSYHWSFTGTHPAELTLTTTGRLHGTLPSSPTQLSFTVKVSDSGSPAQSATKDLTITVTPTPLAITTESLPNSVVNAAYSETLGASGGTPSYHWSFTGGHPTELVLTATGKLRGTLPTSPTLLSFTVKVTDSGSPAQSVTKALTVTVKPALVITTTSLPSGTINSSYSQALGASGGNAPYHWSFTGSHPAELSLTTTGHLHGTLPSSPTQLSFTVKVTDSSAPVQILTEPLTITVRATPLAITAHSLPSSVVNALYSQTLTASGGTPSYRWSFTGTHPAELTLTTTGHLDGTLPSSPTVLSLTVKVTDSGAPVQSVTRLLTITVKAALAITTTSFPQGTVDTAYSLTLGASGGNTPYHWSFTGAHPGGLTLTATGHLHGKLPAVATLLSFTVKVADSSAPVQIATRTLTITVKGGLGYYEVASDGGIFAFNATPTNPAAPFLGSMGGTHLNAPIVGMAVAATGRGYYEVASDGGIFAFNETPTHPAAPFFGSMGGSPLNAPIVGMAIAPTGRGYYEVASDGGLFAFNATPTHPAAPFLGSMGGSPLDAPIIGMAITPTGRGYYEVASDGGLFAFNEKGTPTPTTIAAPFLGSMGGQHLVAPIVGMAVAHTGRGYYEVASDGGLFAFNETPTSPAAPFFGSMGSRILNAPVVQIAVLVTGDGYYEVGADGGIYAFSETPSDPQARFLGSMGGTYLNAPIVGIALARS